MTQSKNMTQAEALDLANHKSGQVYALLRETTDATPLPEVQAAWFELQAANCALLSYISWRKGVPPPDPSMK